MKQPPPYLTHPKDQYCLHCWQTIPHNRPVSYLSSVCPGGTRHEWVYVDESNKDKIRKVELLDGDITVYFDDSNEPFSITEFEPNSYTRIRIEQIVSLMGYSN